MSRLFFTLILFAPLFVFSAQAAEYKRLSVAIKFDEAYLTHLVETIIFRNDDGLSVWGDDSGCNDMTLTDPVVEIVNTQIFINAAIQIKTGWMIGKRCISLLSWQGRIKARQQPTITNIAGAIAFTTVDTELLDNNGKRSSISSNLWDIAKNNVHPHLNALSINLIPAINELKVLIQPFLNLRDVTQSERLRNSFTLQKLTGKRGELSARIGFEVPVIDKSDAQIDVGEPVFSDYEIKQFVAVWEEWDAFLSFVIKVAAQNVFSAEHKEILLDTLIDTRYTIVEALTVPDPQGTDPVRVSFINVWHRLAPVFRSIPIETSGSESLRFFSFINAVDALAAIDELGPVTGWQVSVHGLRRLARLLLPQNGTDSLQQVPGVDQELRDFIPFWTRD